MEHGAVKVRGCLVRVRVGVMIASVNLYHRRRKKCAVLEVDEVPHALRSVGESQTCTAAAT